MEFSKDLNKKFDGQFQHEDLVLKAARSMEDGLYIDPHFPPSANSIGRADNVVWKRPGEIVPDPVMFLDGIEPGDVCQGGLGDCWFLGALSAIAQRNLLYDLIVSTHPEAGFYQFRFFKHNAWVSVTIDDKIPCDPNTNEPVFAHGNDKREMWVPLFEKAYAKLHGSYINLESGSPEYALQDFTGGVSKKLDLAKMLADGTLEKYLNFALLEEQWLLGAACVSNQGSEEDLGNGILNGHAYSLLTIKKTPDKRSVLVQLRNPWGKTEWRGKWSDNDKVWDSAQMCNHFKYKPGDDGAFWMELNEFATVFNRMYECRLYDDDVGKKWARFELEGKFDATSAGGCKNFDTWKNNPQYGCTATRDCTVLVALSQIDERMTRIKGTSMGFTVFRSQEPFKRLASFPQSQAILESPFSNVRVYADDIHLKAGESVILVPCTFDPGQGVRYCFILHASETIRVVTITNEGVVEEDEDELQTKIHGSGVSKDDFVGPISVKRTSTHTQKTQEPATTNNGKAKSLKAPNGDVYTGDVVDGKPHGLGEYVYAANGNKYVGSFRNGLRCGQGVVRDSKGEKIHEGTYAQGHRNGHGIGYIDGDKYIGNYVDGHPSGTGKYIFESGAEYNGEMVKGEFHGYGVYQDAAGTTIYEGDFQNGKRHGNGKLTTPRWFYQGTFRDNKMEGTGRYTYSNGDVFQGGFLANKPHGKGQYLYKDSGELIEGSWENGKHIG
eukprot:TRINITY_DN569_c0_g1_i1.p1 TRINITY_DN569_c0_g1~~TRINITY_DN569_c0_g1_i1.p1  ORF type:complete len:722 (-),score=101.82 TRINITY_DN569_c0_g1_i1:57-2222(-)